ncbi:799_t:CDS:10 [Paraglomus brasilianum]|uniref:alpha-mannosidase n=1 Tax=Paraglomus brasilianum TaxID=144538 RepID=A0A9N8ZT54_9GLOM|nr:799_t:CDS:10 [Paraglomus brasilianum]
MSADPCCRHGYALPAENPRLIRDIAISRLSNFTSNGKFSDVNLSSQLYKHKSKKGYLVKLQVYSVPNLKRIPFKEAIKGDFRPTKVGETFGPSWSTHWFHINVHVPVDWVDEEVQFLWDADSEALVWSVDGVPLQGLTGGDGNDRRHEYILTRSSKGGDIFEFYIEMACNGMFGTGKGDSINPPDPNRTYTLRKAKLAVPNKLAWKLLYDFQIIKDTAQNLRSDEVRSVQALYTANAIVDIFRAGRNGSLIEGHRLAREFFEHKNGGAQHRLTAVGHCHIDTAWLWTFDETKRKVARSWSTQIGLMELYPEYKFVCSQAQQFEWLKQDYPKLFEKVQEKAATNQFLPIGGTWVEMDCNIPSGESLCRQFLFGQRFFEKNFGKRCKVFWLPDTFGYSAQLPQIIKLADCKYFFTQKLSWNNINKFPNTTFYWVGLDGSKVLTHMCPSETYVAQCTVEELVNSVRNHRDLGYSNESLLVFGNGDGGGGPNAAMIERLRRLKDIDGVPRVEMGSADEFYERVERESKKLNVWKGELYFELHRGTYTSHGLIKRYNRKCELLLRDVELLTTLTYFMEQTLYRTQFHDVLPGSSIGMVYDDAYKMLDEVQKTCERLRNQALDALFKLPALEETREKGLAIFNTLPWKRTEVVKVPVSDGLDVLQQYSADKASGYVLVKDTVSVGLQKVEIQRHDDVKPATVKFDKHRGFILENAFVKAVFDSHGRLISLVDLEKSREIIPDDAQGNKFIIYEDIPLYWDAWDVEIYHLGTGREANLGTIKIHEDGPLRASLLLETKLTKTSSLSQVIALTAVSTRLDFETEVDWNENRKFLKVEFPVDIMCDYATYESQFGYIQRPTHYNTTWDTAKFEVCGHKFADFSEYGYGVALLNDCKYGYAVHQNVMRLSLLRSPKAPDDQCDIGHHTFKYALLPHQGSFLESNVIHEAFELNVPLIVRTLSKNRTNILESLSYFTVDAPNVILETVKQAEDSDDVILRLYEAYGGHARVHLKSALPVRAAYMTNILEDNLVKYDYNQDDGIQLKFGPFQVITLKLTMR